MTWKEILKVDLEEARMLGRKHAPADMHEGRKTVDLEKKFANVVLGKDMSPIMLSKIKRGDSKSLEQLKNQINWMMGILPDEQIQDIKVKPEVRREEQRGSILVDAYPDEPAIMTIEYGKPMKTFSFAIQPMKREYSSHLRRPKTKRIKSKHSTRQQKW